MSGQHAVAAQNRVVSRRRRVIGLVLLVAALLGISQLAYAISHDAPWPVALLVGVGAGVGAVALYRAVVARAERREVSELPWRPAGLGRGFALGVGLFALTIGVIAICGGYTAGWGSIGGLLATLGIMTVAAVAEESIFRGVVFRVVEEFAGTRGALAVSGVVFGGLHLLNPHATIVGALAIAVEAGLMLGAAYAWTRSLWLPIGLHLGWNLAEGGIFGVTVSGSSDGPGGLLRGVLHGSSVLSGGTFGPEASVFAIVTGGITALVFYRLARRSGRVLPRRSARA
jgi:membrane protease YdiL (CAAX protease family)